MIMNLEKLFRAKNIAVWWSGRNRGEILSLVFLFLIALGLRLYFQHESIVAEHIISDAREYTIAGYNIYRWDVFSTLAPSSPETAPDPNAKRSPGYPLFLSLFFHISQSPFQFIRWVTTSQAVLGSLSAMLSFLMARFMLNRVWSFFVGLLTALSPHLIASDFYLLTESLFTFVLLAGTVLLFFSWSKGNPVGSLFSGAFFGAAMLIRPIAIFIGPFMAVTYLLGGKIWDPAKRTVTVKQILFFFLGILLIFGPFPVRNKAVLGQMLPEDTRAWNSMIDGSYIDLKYKNPQFWGYPNKDDPENSRMKKEKTYFFQVLMRRLRDRPWDYVKWYLGGKVLCSWGWDLVSGQHDVYVYPMIRMGFHDNPFLKIIHTVMRGIHPLLVLLAFATLSSFLLIKRIRLAHEKGIFLVPVFLIMAYHAVLLTLMLPLPRYTIPLRPYCYLAALTGLYFLKESMKKSLRSRFN
ncbi:MAG: glycosyltransferase family 39 protein [Pseudomonadota bacterium]